MKYKYVEGNWIVAGTSRTVMSRTKLPSGESISDLKVAYGTEITKLTFIEDAKGELFVLSVPAGIEVEYLCGKQRNRRAPRLLIKNGAFSIFHRWEFHDRYRHQQIRGRLEYDVFTLREQERLRSQQSFAGAMQAVEVFAASLRF